MVLYEILDLYKEEEEEAAVLDGTHFSCARSRLGDAQGCRPVRYDSQPRLPSQLDAFLPALSLDLL